MYSNVIKAMKPKINALTMVTIFSVGLPCAFAQDEAPEEKKDEKMSS